MHVRTTPRPATTTRETPHRVATAAATSAIGARRRTATSAPATGERTTTTATAASAREGATTTAASTARMRSTTSAPTSGERTAATTTAAPATITSAAASATAVTTIGQCIASHQGRCRERNKPRFLRKEFRKHGETPLEPFGAHPSRHLPLGQTFVGSPAVAVRRERRGPRPPLSAQRRSSQPCLWRGDPNLQASKLQLRCQTGQPLQKLGNLR